MKMLGLSRFAYAGYENEAIHDELHKREQMEISYARGPSPSKRSKVIDYSYSEFDRLMDDAINQGTNYYSK